MKSTYNRCAVFVTLVSCFILPVFGSPTLFLQNYYIFDDLFDGEHEIRLHYNGFNAKETFVGPAEGSPDGLLVRQISDGNDLITLIYNGFPDTDFNGGSDTNLTLKDCDVNNNEGNLDTYLQEFKEDSVAAEHAAHGSWQGEFTNSSFTTFDSLRDLPLKLRSLVHFRTQKTMCKLHHRQVRKTVKEIKKQNKKTQYLMDSSVGHSRSRRSLAELFIMPGTKWCGDNTLANSENELDGYNHADSCCRNHDSCPYNIAGMSRRFNLYNTRLTAISHCKCDDRFRLCLKHAQTGAANVVGNVFFNLINSKCFVFKRGGSKSCLKWSWWGKCEKYGRQKRAILKNPSRWVR